MKRALFYLIAGLLIFSLQFSCEKANEAPVAEFSYNPTENIYTTTEIQFDASASRDAETESGDLQVRWDWENDGTWDTDYATEKTITHEYTETGTYVVLLEVKDEGDLVASMNETIIVQNIGEGEFADSRDGKTYNYKTIGSQTWMVENLAYLPSVSDSYHGSDDDSYYYVYGYEGDSVSEAKSTENYQKYGVLYNWQAAKTSCPSGWHLPSDEEWKTLERYLGMSDSDIDDTGWRESGDVGEKLKSTSGWYGNGNGSNSTGFNAVPAGGHYNDAGFYDLGRYAYFWSSSPDGASLAWRRDLGFNNDGVYRPNSYRRDGFSVRCLQD